MKLLIVRHAIAVEREKFRGEDDDRPLTDDGRRKMRAVARGLERLLKAPPELLVASPLVRSQQTADILLRKWRGADTVVNRLLRPEVGPEELTSWLERQRKNLIALVGHEPQLSRLAGYLIGGKAAIELKKGGACLVEFDGGVTAGRGRLLWLMTPAALRALS